MILLALEDVSSGRRRDGGLEEVSMTIAPGEIVAIRSRRGSGKTRLLEIAAGHRRPDAGAVLFDGKPPAAALGKKGGIGLAHRRWNPEIGEKLIEHVADPLTWRMGDREAFRIARAALLEAGLRADAEHERPHDLERAERRRASIVRALMTRPRLLIVDEPTSGLDAGDRDDLHRWLQQRTEGGIAVLMTVDSAAGLAGTRALSLHDGRLVGDVDSRSAAVLPLRPRRAL